jgi:hypothetical protein
MEIGRPHLGQRRPGPDAPSLRSSDFRFGVFKIRTSPMNERIATVTDATSQYRDAGFGQGLFISKNKMKVPITDTTSTN